MMSENHEVVTALNEIRDVLANQSSLEGALLVAILGAFAGACSAYFFSVLASRKQRSADGARLLIGLVEGLEETAVAYWLSDNEPATNTTVRLQEFQIKSHLKLTVKYVRLLKLTKVDKDVISHLDLFCSRVFRVATGGDFESGDRKASVRIAGQVSKLCIEAKAVLIEVALF